MEILKEITSFLGLYPSWVRYLFSCWILLSAFLVIAFIFTKMDPPSIQAELSTPHSAQGANPQINTTLIFPPPVIIVLGSGPVEWRRTYIATTDDQGRRLSVTIGVLWDPYRWTLGSSEKVGISDAESIPIDRVIKSLESNERRPIIAVGMASHENTADQPDVEEARAGDRADRLVELCSRHFSSAEIWSLNLGYFQGAGSHAPATERRVLLLVIETQEHGADLTSGVRNALLEASKKQRLSFHAEFYSNFPIGKFNLKIRRSAAPLNSHLTIVQPRINRSN